MVFDIGTMINSDSILPNNPTSNNNPVLVGSDRIGSRKTPMPIRQTMCEADVRNKEINALYKSWY